MSNHIGIDLGTTNSAICSFDGRESRIWKSPEGEDVTPSAIYFGEQGNKIVGRRAYDLSVGQPERTATSFKRMMGTSTPISLPALDASLTPEECSSEILKVMFNYLPHEVRDASDTGSVITVPAAFNQMQKDATQMAAEKAGIGKIALIQEPVAAIMSVMRKRKYDGMHLIYDFGGGTLDIAIAQCVDGRITLLETGGMSMCGGRDFDRTIVDRIITPWLMDNFNLPEDLSTNIDYRPMLRSAMWAAEKAKIDLSGNSESMISLSENQLRMTDIDGKDMYLHIPFDRTSYDGIIAERIRDTIKAVKETLDKADMDPGDMDNIVFIGGPTNYQPLRGMVTSDLGISCSLDGDTVDPMTAVATGASMFAESIDWKSSDRSRKKTSGRLESSGKTGIVFNYTSRTSDERSRIVVMLENRNVDGEEFQVDNKSTGWTSGRHPLEDGKQIYIPLTTLGVNRFRVTAFDENGRTMPLEQNELSITRTAATIDAIPASHSIGIEVLDKLGGRPVLEYLVRSGDHLPMKSSRLFKAGDLLESGSAGTINFKIWEGEIEDNITDNRFVGVLKVNGNDFDEGTIQAGDDLLCEYEIQDSGNISLEVSIPSIESVFNSNKNYYSRQESQMDYTTSAEIVVEEACKTMGKIDDMQDVISDPELEEAKRKLDPSLALDPSSTDVERTQEAWENVLTARRVMARARKNNRRKIREMDLDHEIRVYNDYNRRYSVSSEETAFDNLVQTLKRAVDRDDTQFEMHIEKLRRKNVEKLWRQEWFVVEQFKLLLESPSLYSDKQRFRELSKKGMRHMLASETDELRVVISDLHKIRIHISPVENMFDHVNIIR